MKMRLMVTVVALLSTISACHESGTWTDDSKNWQRAFRSTKPPDVIVIHSYYWRSPHFTQEFQYFFHIQRNDVLRKQLFESHGLKQINGRDEKESFQDFFGEKPSWFIPQSPERYDVWIYGQEPRGHFRVFIDKGTQDLFLTDYQV